MRRTFKVSHRFYDSSAVAKVGNDGIGLWVLAGSWVAAQDEPVLPPVPASVLRLWSSNASRTSSKLVGAGLWAFTPERLYDEVYEDAWSFVPNDRLYVFAAASRWREAIPDALRQRVYERDGRVCLRCGTGDNLSLDHIYPYSLGGPDSYENLQTLCTSCNSSKGARV